MKLTFVLLYITLSTILFHELSASPSFDEEVAKEAWFYCIASYCPQDSILNWRAGKISQLYPNMKDIRVAYNENDSTFAYLGYNSKSNIIYIVFRGSVSVTNWMNNFKVFKDSYSYCQGCEVHRGFYNTFLNVKPDIIKHLNGLRKLYPTALVRVIGHSMGGALALLTALDIIKNICDIDALYTFGQPRVGNENFAKYANQMLRGKVSARITNGQDPGKDIYIYKDISSKLNLFIISATNSHQFDGIYPS